MSNLLLEAQGLKVLTQTLEAMLFKDEGDLYERLNAFRAWFNTTLPGYNLHYDLYLEDVWNEHAAGQTWFEYIIRSPKTKDEMPPLAYDVYLNHQDAGGVWHLGDYQHSKLAITSIQPVLDFITQTQAYLNQ